MILGRSRSKWGNKRAARGAGTPMGGKCRDISLRYIYYNLYPYFVKKIGGINRENTSDYEN